MKNGDNVRIYCNLDINGKLVNFMLDCGATCNVLPRAEAIVVNRKSADLKPPKSRHSMYDGTELKTLGMVTAEVVHPRSESVVRWIFMLLLHTIALYLESRREKRWI